MYLLHSRSILETEDFERKRRIESALRTKEMLRKRQASELAQSDPFKDPEISAKLGPVTRSILLEYRGKAGIYQVTHYKKHVDSRTQMEIGRAMVLRGREFGLLDEIVLDIFKSTFYRYLRANSLSFSSPSTAQPSFDYGYLERIFEDYLVAGRSFVAPYELKWKSSMGTVYLQLEEHKGKLRWSVRGTSAIRSAHRTFAYELNSILNDYEDRLQWMERYRNSEPKPGLGTKPLAELRKELKTYFSRPFDLSGLEPGVSFGDEPVILDRRYDEGIRGYVARCESCDRPAFMEVICSYPREGRIDWASSKDTFTSKLPEQDASKILLRDHQQSGCSWKFARSSRTGEQIRIAEN